MKHYSVLSKETIKKLNLKDDGIYVDCTLGLGGHTKLIAQKVTKGKIVVFDQDLQAMNEAKKNLKDYDNIIYVNSNFTNIDIELKKLNIEKVDGVLYDLGTSYYQLTDEDRGFSYHGDIKLDMRMNQDQEFSAIDILNEYSEEDLTDIFYKYGDEPQARKIAREIVEYRKSIKIERSSQLNELIKNVKGYSKHKHPSKNIYQAIRIEVNNEISVISDSINKAISFLKKNGVVVAITFHSLEDKAVKDVFWQYKQKIDITPMGNIHNFKTSKSIYPTKAEIEENKASRSAKLRTLTKLT